MASGDKCHVKRETVLRAEHPKGDATSRNRNTDLSITGEISYFTATMNSSQAQIP